MNYRFRYPEYAEALYQALADDAFYITMERSVGDAKSGKPAMLRYMDYSMVEAESYGELLLRGGHGLGASIWSRPLDQKAGRRKDEKKKDFLKTYMGQASLEKYRAIVEFMAEKAAPLTGDGFWYLSIVGILPAYQGQGLGNGLIRPILDKTDSLDAPTYLETFTPRNMKFYERLGFRSAGLVHEPTTDADYRLMIREPRAG